MNKFNELIKNTKLLRAIEDIGYDKPTEIQERAIPFVLEGRDLIAKSNTGTGKTASFGLPLLEKICEGEINQVLIVCPTRELVMQVEDEIRKYTKYTEFIKIMSVFGGTPIDRQIRAIKKGVKIIVGTPGRILDHVKRKTIKLKDYDCVVLDEADEMLNMGFRDDIELILSKIEKEHQTILFSATMPKPIRDIAKTYLKNQVEIEVKAQYKTVETIDQVYYEIKRQGKKAEAVHQLLTYYSPNLSIIFCNMKSSVDDLVDDLNKSGIKAVGLHGDIKQDKRTKIMANFKKSKKAILVASDVAARGIDVNNIDLVLNYDLPQDNEVYVHRIGRTGRAGKNGLAVTLVQGRKQNDRLRSVMKFTKANIVKKELPTLKDIQLKQQSQMMNQLTSLMDNQGIIPEHQKLMDDLLAQGYSYETMVSSLLTMVQGGEVIPTTPMKKKRKVKDGVELKFTIGSEKKISPADIEHAILADCKVKQDQIGMIDIRKRYSIVIVEKDIAKKIINEMGKTKINNHVFDVRLYKKEKKNDLYN